MSKFVDLQETRESSGRRADSDSSSGNDNDETLSTDVDDLLQFTDKGNISKTSYTLYTLSENFPLFYLLAY